MRERFGPRPQELERRTKLRQASEARVSVAWNVTFDLGTGIGALAVGAVARASSLATALHLLGALAVVAAVAIWISDRRRRA